MKDKPRIGTSTTLRIEVYNLNYGVLGSRLGDYKKPWCALTPWDAAQFDTHAEALAWAFKEARQNQ